MQIEKREYKVYNYDELSEEAKQKALEEFAYINVDDIGYWAYSDSILDIANRYGLKISFAEMCFDLERGAYVYFDAKHDGGSHTAQLFVEDYKKFAEEAGIKSKKEIESLDGNIVIEAEHFGGGSGKNYIRVNNEVSMEAEKKLDEALERFLEEVLQSLKDEYEYHTSEEAVKDTLLNNDYKFFEDGKPFSL